MAVNPIVTAGKAIQIAVDSQNTAGALVAGTSPGAFTIFGGVGTFTPTTATNRGGSRYDLEITSANVPTQNAVMVFKATGIVHQQFQIFPEGPIKGVAQRVWFVKISSVDGTHELTATAPTVEWIAFGTGTAVTLTPVNPQPGYWYADLTSGHTNADSGVFRVTGAGLVPLSLPLFFSTTAAGGGGGTGEDEENMIPDATYVRSTSTSWATDASVVAGDKVRLTPGRPGDEIEYWVVGSTARSGNGVPVPVTGRIVTIPTGGVLQYRSLSGAPTLVVEVQNA